MIKYDYQILRFIHYKDALFSNSKCMSLKVVSESEAEEFAKNVKMAMEKSGVL